MKPSIALVSFFLFFSGCDPSPLPGENESPFHKLTKDEVLYYLMLETKGRLEEKSFAEVKRLVVLDDKEFMFLVDGIAAELEQKPFTDEEFLKVYRAIDLARFAHQNAVVVPKRRQELASKILQMSRFAGEEFKEMRDGIQKEMAAEENRESEFFPILAHNAVLYETCREILKKRKQFNQTPRSPQGPLQ